MNTWHIIFFMVSLCTPKVGRATICVVPMTFKWNMVKNDKGVLKAICGNKTLKAVQRSTSSS